MNRLESIEKEQMRMDLPGFSAGDTIRVHFKIVEGEKERIQQFQGAVISKRGSGSSKTFTVRKISNGVGVEKTFAMHSPRLEKVEIVSKGKVRRSRLFYLRDRRGKAARIKERGIN